MVYMASRKDPDPWVVVSGKIRASERAAFQAALEKDGLTINQALVEFVRFNLRGGGTPDEETGAAAPLAQVPPGGLPLAAGGALLPGARQGLRASESSPGPQEVAAVSCPACLALNLVPLDGGRHACSICSISLPML